jgi:type IV secretory pathway VirB10-like protein
MSYAVTLNEIEAALGTSRKAGEPVKDYLKRVAVKVNRLEDDDWELLPKPVQDWTNDALEALAKKAAVPLPAGVDADEAAEAVTEETSEVEEETDMTTAKKKKAAPAKKAPVPKRAGSTRGRATPRDAKITVLAKKNPYRDGCRMHNLFNQYKTGMTFEDALDKAEGGKGGVPRQFLLWDRRMGYIKF